MKTIKEAAEALLSRNEITQEEYNQIEKTGAFKAEDIANGIKQFSGWLGKNQNLTEGVKALKMGGGFIGNKAKGVSQFAKNYGTGIAATAAGAAIGKEMFIDPMIEKNRINNSYSTMLQKTPQLSGEDAGKIRDYFDVVKTFSPHAASNPLVAGSIVNKMVQFGGVDHKLVQDLASIQSGRNSEGLVSQILQGGAKSLTGSNGKKES